MVTISSANAGQLAHESADEAIDYTLKYDGVAVDLAGGQSFTNSAAAAVAVNKDVTISYEGQDFVDLVAGNYEDTITFQISAN